MAYVQPSTGDLIGRFPEFALVSPSVLSAVLDEAIADVGEMWFEKDRRPAMLYLAAHLLTIEGEPGRSATGNGIGISGPMKSRKVGDVWTEFAAFGSSANGMTAQGFGSTTYGQRYEELLRRNFGGPIVV